MNSMKKNCLVFGLLILLFVAFTTAASAQFFYPPTVPFYGYNTLPPGFGYFPPAPVPPIPPTGYGQPYRGANALLTTLSLLGLLPTTTTTLLPTLPTTTTTIGTTTALLLGGVSTTSLLLASTLPTTTLLPTTTTTIGTTTALLLGGVNTTTLLLLGI